jgi:hypothetical protein
MPPSPDILRPLVSIPRIPRILVSPPHFHSTDMPGVYSIDTHAVETSFFLALTPNAVGTSVACSDASGKDAHYLRVSS